MLDQRTNICIHKYLLHLVYLSIVYLASTPLGATANDCQISGFLAEIKTATSKNTVLDLNSTSFSTPNELLCSQSNLNQNRSEETKKVNDLFYEVLSSHEDIGIRLTIILEEGFGSNEIQNTQFQSLVRLIFDLIPSNARLKDFRNSLIIYLLVLAVESYDQGQTQNLIAKALELQIDFGYATNYPLEDKSVSKLILYLPVSPQFWRPESSSSLLALTTFLYSSGLEMTSSHAMIRFLSRAKSIVWNSDLFNLVDTAIERMPQFDQSLFYADILIDPDVKLEFKILAAKKYLRLIDEISAKSNLFLTAKVLNNLTNKQSANKDLLEKIGLEPAMLIFSYLGDEMKNLFLLLKTITSTNLSSTELKDVYYASLGLQGALTNHELIGYVEAAMKCRLALVSIDEGSNSRLAFDKQANRQSGKLLK